MAWSGAQHCDLTVVDQVDSCLGLDTLLDLCDINILNI